MKEKLVIAIFPTSLLTPSSLSLALQKARLDNAGLQVILLRNALDAKPMLAAQQLAKENSIDLISSSRSRLVKTIKELAQNYDIQAIYVADFNRASLSHYRHEHLLQKLQKTFSQIEVSNFLAKQMSSFQQKSQDSTSFFSNLVLVLFSSTIATFLGLAFDLLDTGQFSITPFYMLNVLVCTLLIGSLGWSLFATVLSLLLYSFFFSSPRFNFAAGGLDYFLSAVVLVATSLIAGYLSYMLQNTSREAQYLSNTQQVLLDTNQALQKAVDEEEIERITLEQVYNLLNWEVILFKPDDKLGFVRRQINRPQSEVPPLLTMPERQAVGWVWEHGEIAGSSQKDFPALPYLFFPVKTKERNYRVAAIYLLHEEISPSEIAMIQAIFNEAGLALENIERAESIQQANLALETEKARSSLLKAISHDIRTPITSLSGNASNLVQNAQSFSEKEKEKIYLDMLENSNWLNTLVLNLLLASQMENETLSLNKTQELVQDILEQAISDARQSYPDLELDYDFCDEIILSNCDANLILEVLRNLIHNAIFHNDSDHPKIYLSSKMVGDEIWITIKDNGPGIHTEDREQIFDLFYTGKKRVDADRSVGLGLYLCRQIVEAHRGKIWLDPVKEGASFTFSLPATSF